MADYENIEFIKTEHVKHLDAYGFRLNLNGKNPSFSADSKGD